MTGSVLYQQAATFTSRLGIDLKKMNQGRVIFKIRLDQTGISRSIEGEQRNLQSTCMLLNETLEVSSDLQQVMLAMAMMRVNGYEETEGSDGPIYVFTLQQETYEEQYYPKALLMKKLLKESFAKQIEEQKALKNMKDFKKEIDIENNESQITQ